jgi:outer membrane receptor protein involved in Fe transport
MIHFKKFALIVLCFLHISLYPNNLVKTISVSGFIKDSLTLEPLPYASISFQLVSDTNKLLGAITNSEGFFKINLSPDLYKVKISYVGYLPKEFVLTITPNIKPLSFFLNEYNYSISEVEIIANKSLIEKNIEITTINVSQNTTTVGGTAKDVLATLPSVDFDVDGILNYRGSDKVLILINGERSALVKSLDQIPADQIEKIELINNPSAKYESEGMSGIINVILKSKVKKTTNTAFVFYVGLPQTAGGNFSFSGVKNRLNYFVNAGYSYHTVFQTKEHFRDNIDKPFSNDYFQFDRMDEVNNSTFINSDLDYNLSKRHQIGVSFMASLARNFADRLIHYQTTTELTNSYFNSYKSIEIPLYNTIVNGNLRYKYLFPKKGELIKSNFRYAHFFQNQSMNSIHYRDTLFTINPFLQYTSTSQRNDEIDYSLDYINPITDSLSLELGYNLAFKYLTNHFYSNSFDRTKMYWVEDVDLLSKFNFKQLVHAMYASVYYKLKLAEILAGLRAEYTYNTQNDSNLHQYLDLFPSVNLSRQLSKSVSVFCGYSRRINRPTIKMLNPYSDEFADILNMHVGNPNLKPEYVNSLEMGLRLTKNKFSGFTSIYYRNINQAITRIKSATNDSALLVSFINLNNAKMWGSEISVAFKISKWWNLNISGNLFSTQFSGQFGFNDINKSLLSWNSNFNNQFRFPLGFSIQVNGIYRSKLPSIMGVYQSRYMVDFALSKKIFKDKGQVVFKISDVFNSYRYGLDLEAFDDQGYIYTQTNRRKNQSQYFILSFVYNITSKDSTKSNKKSSFFLDDFEK